MKKNKFLPDYKGNSIVNLMSSIRAIYGSDYLYPLLDGFDIGPFREKNIVFIVIDGLGYDYLMSCDDNSFFKKNTIQKMTSVFLGCMGSKIGKMRALDL